MIVLDEPVSALDPEGRRDVLGLIAGLRGESTVLFSTHVLADVERICDRVGILDHGHLVVEGPLADLLDRYALPVWRIEAEPGQDAAVEALAAQLRGLAWITAAVVDHGLLTVAVSDPAAAARELLQIVGAADLAVVSVGPRPTNPGGRVPAADRRLGRGRGVSGFGVLMRKELLEAWRTRRLPVVAVLFLVVGIISPLTAKYLNEIVTLAAGDQLPLALPDPTVTMALEQFQKNLGQLGALAAIALAMGSVSGELDRGTAAMVLAQPVGRPAFLAAKLLAIAAVLGIAMLIGSTVAWIYTAILFEPLPLGGWLAMTVLSWLALTSLGGADVPCVGGHGLHDGRGRDRVRRPHRAQPGRDRARRRPAPADRSRCPCHGARGGNGRGRRHGASRHRGRRFPGPRRRGAGRRRGCLRAPGDLTAGRSARGFLHNARGRRSCVR